LTRLSFKNLDTVFDIKKSVMENLKKERKNYEGWAIKFKLDTFEFEDKEYEFLDNYIVYQIVNHDLQISYSIHHQIEEDGCHHLWWYNFEEILTTKEPEKVKECLELFIQSLMLKHSTSSKEDK